MCKQQSVLGTVSSQASLLYGECSFADCCCNETLHESHFLLQDSSKNDRNHESKTQIMGELEATHYWNRRRSNMALTQESLLYV